LVARDVVEECAAIASAAARQLGEVMLERGVIDERDLFRTLASANGLRFAEADELFSQLQPELVHSVPRAFQEHEHVLPVAVAEGRLIIAAANVRAQVQQLAHANQARDVELVIVTPTDLQRLRAAVDLGQLPAAPAGAAIRPGVRDLMALRQDAIGAEMVQMLDSILLDAIAERASDIHLEIYGARVRLRLRIDGDLHDLTRYNLTPLQLAGVINVLKVTARLDIAERRLPQGGRCTTRAGGHVFDLRVQTQPSLHGEHVVVRLLPQDTRLLSVMDLGFPERIAVSYMRILQSPSGLMLVVGPTGSGKSTTLYGGLLALSRDTSRKVISVEDPIEYAVEGVQQSQARPEIGFSFAHAMRAFVREDPDVIMVGEIRDGETALEAIRASQTGHLVLSTLHCNDSVDAVQRLLDLGMHHNSVGSELQAVLSQRLARRICPECRVPDVPDPALLRDVFGGPQPGFTCFKGKGCARCHGIGSRGRIAAAEILLAGPELRLAISHRVPVDELRQVALKAGLVPMREHALSMVQAGIIPFTDLRSMLSLERLAGDVLSVPPGAI